MRLAIVALGAAAALALFAQTGHGATAGCPQGATMSIVAHPDDDLIFLSPDLLHDVQSGRCSSTVFVTAGDSGDGMGYGSVRESGIKAAYAQMAGVANSWSTSDAGISGHPTPRLTLNGKSTVSIVFMRLPNAQSSGAPYPQHPGQTLQALWEGSISTIATVDGASSYTKAGLTSALTGLMTAFQPDTIRTQDYVGGIGDGDHSDHHETAYFARAAHAGYGTAHVFIGYLDYGSSGRPQNVTGSDLTAKMKALDTYAGFDTICGSPPSCAGTMYGTWALRQYTVGSENGGGGTPPPPPPPPPAPTPTPTPTPSPMPSVTPTPTPSPSPTPSAAPFTPPLPDLAPKLARAGKLAGTLRVDRFGRLHIRLRSDRAASVTLVAHDLRTGKRLTLRSGSRIAGTILKKPALTATSRVGKAGAFPLSAWIPSGVLTHSARYELVLTATSSTGKIGTLRIRFTA